MNNLIRAEFLRFFGTRLWVAYLLGALATGVGLVGLLVLVGPENAEPPLPPIDTPAGVSTILGLVQLMLFVPAVLGTFAITAEYRHGTIGTTFLAVPRRARVMVAKLVAHATLGLAYGVVLAVGAGAALAAGVLTSGGDLGAGLPGLLVSLGRLAVGAMAYTVLGVAVGALVRNQIVGLAAVFGYFYALEPMLMIIPGVNQLYGVLPGGAMAALTRSTWLTETLAEQTSSMTALVLPAWGGGLVLLGYVVLAALVAVALPLRRDLV
ncbi:ABC transporter permease [Propionibacteriaceae bacterium Y2011]